MTKKKIPIYNGKLRKHGDNVLFYGRAEEFFGIVSAGKTFVIAPSSAHTLAVDFDRAGWAWGFNNTGQVGDNTITSRRTPVRICAPTGSPQIIYYDISAGAGHSIGIDDKGKAWGWGLNNRGQIGDNSVTCRARPVAVLGAAKTFCKISVGTRNSYAIDKNGQVWLWGSISGMGAPSGIASSVRTPVSLAGSKKTFCEISTFGDPDITNDFHILAIDYTGKGWAWGEGGDGQLGRNSTVNFNSPVRICGNKTFCQISAGQNHSLAIDNNGIAWGWGYNDTGKIGDNTINQRNTPVRICGNKTFCQISAGNNFSVAIDYQGKAWAWGRGVEGQLGRNSTSEVSTPVRVCGNRTFCRISAGTNMAIAIDNNKDFWAWGINTNGQLGDNTTTTRLTPVKVCKI